jgi:hypothetical protein
VGKFAGAAGAVKYRLDRRSGRRDMMVEYKSAAPEAAAAETNESGGR